MKTNVFSVGERTGVCINTPRFIALQRTSLRAHPSIRRSHRYKEFQDSEAKSKTPLTTDKNPYKTQA